MKKYLFLLLTILFMIQFSPSSVLGEGRVFEFESNTYVAYWHNNNPDYISFDSVRTNGSKVRETLHQRDFFDGITIIKDASFIPLPDYITDLSQVDIEMIGELRAHIYDPLNSPRHDGVQIVNINGQRHLYIPIFTSPVLARKSGLIYKIGSNPDVYRYDSNVKFRITFAAEPKLVIEPPERTIKTGETASYRAILISKNIDGTEKKYDVTNRAETIWSLEEQAGRATMIGKGRFRGEAIGDVDIKAKFTRDTGDVVVAENAKLYIQDVPIGLTVGEYCDEQENLNVRAILQSQDDLTKIEWTLRSGEAIIHSETSNNPSTSTQFIYPLENGQSYNLNVKVYYADGREETFTETFTYDVVCGEVDLFISQIDSPKAAKAGDRILTKISYGSLATTIHAKQTKIRLYLNNQLVGERSVSVPPGVNREIYIEWNVPNIKGNGTLRATINIPAEFTEITMSNNEKTMSMAIKEDESPSTPSNPPNTNFCAGNNNTSNVHFQIDECTVIPGDCTVDEEGNIDCDPPYCQFNTLYFSEYIDVKITNIKPKKLRAGYGFEYYVETTYTNEGDTGISGGADSVHSEFVESWLSNYLETPVDLEIHAESMSVDTFQVQVDVDRWQELVSYKESITWKLPPVFVEKYSGNAFYDPNHIMRELNDELIDGGSKWYVSFDTPDGKYPFSATVYGGVTGLSDCVDNSEVEIEGVAYDDFVLREVSINTPFPAGVGWNWKGKESIIADQQDWYFKSSENYRNYTSSDPNNRVYHLNTCIRNNLIENNRNIEYFIPNELYHFHSLYGAMNNCR